MSTITVTPADVASAASFLEAYLTDKYPTVDVTPGSMFRDVLIDGMAAIVAYLRAEVSRVKALQSLSSIASLPDDQDRNDAIDALLSNFFLTRKEGRLSRGLATLHLTEAVDVTVNLTDVFSRGGLNFSPDYTATQVIPASALATVTGTSGEAVEYTVAIPVVSTTKGVEYDIPAGGFDSFTQISPALKSVTADNAFTGGSSLETTDELLARASTAVTLRGMVTAKSVRTTLLDAFSSLIDVVVVGMGDPEMFRDSLPYSEFHSGLHRGGFTDVYVDTGVKENVVLEDVVGAAVTYNTQLPLLLDDVSIPDPIAAGVTNGQFMRVYNASSGEPDLFAVSGTAGTAIVVDSRLPFPGVKSGVDYSIGTIAPSYNDVITRRATGVYTTSVSVPDGIINTVEPVLRVTDVSIYDPTDVFGLYDVVDKRIHFTQVNKKPTLVYGDAGYTPEYYIEYVNPQEARSNRQIMAIHTDPAFSGYTLRVVYDTAPDYAAIETAVNSADTRLLTTNTLVRAFNPVYLSFDVKYTLKPTADSATIDEGAIKLALSTYLNSISLSDTLNVSDIITFVMDQDLNIGSVVPNATVAGSPVDYAVLYTLQSPDGRAIEYWTIDEVAISESKLTGTTPEAVLTDTVAKELGLSSRTIRYIATTSDITFTKV